jgi:CHAT domain-containing protein/Tfp pilus assembly protein PilF
MFRLWAGTFEDRSDWANAEKYNRLALAEDQSVTPETLAAAEDITRLGILASKRGDIAKAEEYARQAWSIRQKLAPGSIQVARSLTNLGDLAWRRGDLAKAEEYSLQALAIEEKNAPGSLDLAQIFNNLGLIFFQRGDWAKAEEYGVRALDLRQTLIPGSLDVADSFNNLGLAAWQLGNLAKADEYSLQALAIREKVAPGSLDVAMSLDNLGTMAEQRGDLTQAESYHLRALHARNKLAPETLDVVACLDSLGEIALQRRDLAKAETYLSHALRIQKRLAPDSLDLSYILNDLGEVALQEGNVVRARNYLDQALAIKEKLAPGNSDVVLTLVNLGTVEWKRGDTAKAEEYLREALKRTTPGSPYLAWVFNKLGELARGKGDISAAEDYYRQALNLWEKMAPGSKDQAEAMAALAAILQQKGQADAAEEFYRQALGALENQTSRLGGSEQVRAGFRANYGNYYKDYADLLIEQHKPESAFQILERAQAQTMLELLTAGEVKIHKGGALPLLEQERILQGAIVERLNRRLQLLNDKHTEEQLAEMDKEVKDFLTRYEAVEEKIRASNPSYAALTQPQAMSLQDVQRQLLDSGTVLLEYSLGEARSYVFVISENSLATYELPRRSIIELAARRLYQLLTARNSPEKTGNSSEAEYARVAAKLTRMLLRPAAARLKKKRLLIVSDGALRYVPFAALPAPDTPATPLIAEHEIVNLPSATVLSVLRQARAGRKTPPRAVAVLADPVFDSHDVRVRRATLRQGEVTRVRQQAPVGTSTGALLSSQRGTGTQTEPGAGLKETVYLPRLQLTRQEARSILAVTPPGQGMQALDFSANRETATSPQLAQYRMVHFATHGLVNSQHPELSGLVLSLVDETGKPQNGFLALQDIYNLNLPVELVVLSGCETALGKDIQGEGLIGLTWGFMYAGAPRVVASLWKIDDLATAELMARFYKAIEQQGMRPAAALQAAQIQIWRQQRWKSPYYWAAFQIQGEWK